MTLSDAFAKLINAIAEFIIKIQGGRFILTVVGAICFYLFVSMVCNILQIKMMELTINDITAILNPIITPIILVISNVFTFYFLKGPDGNNGNGNRHDTTTTTTLKP
jgi:hypothetical protein